MVSGCKMVAGSTQNGGRPEEKFGGNIVAGTKWCPGTKWWPAGGKMVAGWGQNGGRGKMVTGGKMVAGLLGMKKVDMKLRHEAVEN